MRTGTVPRGAAGSKPHELYSWWNSVTGTTDYRIFRPGRDCVLVGVELAALCADYGGNSGAFQISHASAGIKLANTVVQDSDIICTAYFQLYGDSNAWKPINRFLNHDETLYLWWISPAAVFACMAQLHIEY